MLAEQLVLAFLGEAWDKSADDDASAAARASDDDERDDDVADATADAAAASTNASEAARLQLRAASMTLLGAARGDTDSLHALAERLNARASVDAANAPAASADGPAPRKSFYSVAAVRGAIAAILARRTREVTPRRSRAASGPEQLLKGRAARSTSCVCVCAVVPPRVLK